MTKEWLENRKIGPILEAFSETANASEVKVIDFIKEMVRRYNSLSFPPPPRLEISSLHKEMCNTRPALLTVLGRYAVATNVFVPIREMLTEWNDFSYERQDALWAGTGYKGIHAYGPDFIRKGLNQEEPMDGLFSLHCKMAVKKFEPTEIYVKTMQEAHLNPEKPFLWTSNHPKAVDFRNEVFTKSSELEKVFNHLKSNIKVISFSKIPTDNIRLCRNALEK